HRNPQQAAPNKPKLRHAGYLRDWLICGEFEGDDHDVIAHDPIHELWTSIQVQGRALSPEERAFPGGEQALMPREGDELMGKRWTRHTPTRDLVGDTGVHDGELDLIFLRRGGGEGPFPIRRRNVYVYAASYVWSPESQDATIWAGAPSPFKLYLNDEECFRCGRGTGQDDAVRDVRLRKGWNRVLVQTTDQAEDEWMFSVKFTDRDRNDLPALKVSSTRPEELNPETMLFDADEAGPCVPPIGVPLTHYSWAGDVADDWWGVLPVLNEQHFEAMLGQRGVRIDGSYGLERTEDGPDHSQYDKVMLVDVSAIKGIQSRVTTTPSQYDSLLNNLINWSIETTALVRYADPATGKPRDLLFVRIDMVEPYIELIDVADERPLRDSIIGVILRDTKQAVVFDTYLGEPLPANELSMLSVRDGAVSLRAWPSVPRVVRGEPLTLNLEAKYAPPESENAPDLEDVELSLVPQRRPETADTIEFGTGYSSSTPWAKAGMAPLIAPEIDTTTLRAGVSTFVGAVSYTIDGERRTLSRPVPIPVFDPVDVTLNINGSSLLTTPHATAVVLVQNNLTKTARGSVRLDLPKGWTAKPAKQSFALAKQDDEVRVEFALTLSPDTPSTTVVLRAVADVGAARGVTSTGEHQVQVALGDALIDEDFEHEIPSDFAVTNGLYKVSLAHQDRAEPVAYKGSTCLLVQDSGGARYGHVYMFGKDRFWPAGRRKPHTTYTFDTNDYPIVEWWMRSNAVDANLGINVRIETGHDQRWCGVLLHGLWEQQWDHSQRIATIPFTPDRRWHKITINLDELLDAYLGDEPHLVSEIRFGDTRIFASGWWFDASKYSHYIDEFTIRKARSDEAHVTPAQVLRLEGEDRPPAFELPEPHGDVALTVRPREVSTTQNEAIFLDGWISNLGTSPVAVPRFPESGRFAIKLVDEQGNNVFDDQAGGWLDVSPSEPAGELVTLKTNESTRWSREHDGAILLGKPVEEFFRKKTGSSLVPAGTYRLSAKVVCGEQTEVVSNTIPLVVTPSPTKEQLLAQLQSPFERDRARAVTALHRAGYADALPAIAAMLTDTDATVRLNAAYAIGEIGGSTRRLDMDRLRSEFGTSRDEAAGRLATLNETWNPVVDALIRTLDDENWRVGEYAGFALAKIGDVRGIEPLSSRLTNASPWLRRRAAEALAEYWVHMPPDANDADGRRAAVDAVVLAFDRLVAATDNEMSSTRLAAYQACRKFIGRPEWSGEGEALARDKLVPVIRKAFTDPCWNVRVEAAAWAAEWPGTDLSLELTAMLRDPDWIAREHLAGRLADLANRRGDDAVNAARAAAETEGEALSNEQVNTIVLAAKRPEIAMLKTLLADERIEVRWAAVRALHRLNTGQTIEELTGRDAHSWRAMTN
ncbi:MAG: HEAT repeat domain-containing protein, partial [Verrucomicrobia bacterium]|nr:HEAT repeat domain-containing protein [Verrucomicrobiota bacterium]